MDALAKPGDLTRKARQLRNVSVGSSIYGAILVAVFTLPTALVTAVVYGAGGALAAEGAVTTGTVVALVAYLGRLYGPLIPSPISPGVLSPSKCLSTEYSSYSISRAWRRRTTDTR